MKITQRERIIKYIRDYGSITSFEAYKDLGITQLATRIKELKDEGYNFRTEWKVDKNKYGDTINYKRYYLLDEVADNMQHIPQM